MAKRDAKRPTITLVSTAGTGTTYTTTKNRTTQRERLELRKYDRAIRQVVTFREKR